MYQNDECGTSGALSDQFAIEFDVLEAGRHEHIVDRNPATTHVRRAPDICVDQLDFALRAVAERGRAIVGHAAQEVAADAFFDGR